MRYLFIMSLIACLLGCIPTSDNPLTSPGKEEIDPAVLGTWFWKDENETGFIHIGLDEESKLLRLIMLEFDRRGEMDVSEFSGHTSSLNGNKYLNLKWVRPVQDDITGYLFVKYKVSSSSLGIAIMDGKVVDEAIKGGTLKGKVKKHKWFSSVRIIEGQKKLQEFVSQKDKTLFPDMTYLPRLKLPKKSPMKAP